jgi:hypothetical protein
MGSDVGAFLGAEDGSRSGGSVLMRPHCREGSMFDHGTKSFYCLFS